jgi:hypothetical protein
VGCPILFVPPLYVQYVHMYVHDLVAALASDVPAPASGSYDVSATSLGPEIVMEMGSLANPLYGDLAMVPMSWPLRAK